MRVVNTILSWAIVPVGLLLSTPIVLASDVNVRCVQGQLNMLGYDAGAVDGLWGAKTRSAAEAYSASPEQTLDLSPISKETAGDWCEALAAAYPKLLPFASERGDMIYDIADNVPRNQVALIKAGFVIAENYINAALGGAIPHNVQSQVTVKIVSTGEGNQERGGGGGVATAFAASGIRPFFDVGHVQWNQNSSGRGWSTETDSMKTVVHEYTHGWQSSLGAISISNQPLGNWINEGLAEYVAYSALEDAGRVSWENVRPFMLQGAMQDQLGAPLQEVQNNTWPGHVGFLAIDWLVSEAPEGSMSLRTIATEIGDGKSLKAAFKTAFNIELDDFYDQFEAWRLVILDNPSKAIANRPPLRNIGE